MNRAIGFLALEETNDRKGFIGALLVTDDLGKPEEFRVTYPLKPTPVQKQLYGKSMLPHIGVNLCGIPLYEALKNKPELLVIKDKQILPISEKIDCCVVYLTRRGEKLEIKDDSTQDEAEESPHMKTDPGGHQPVSVIYPPNYGNEMKDRTKAFLGHYYQAIDLLEPFERIKGAIAALAEQDEKFK